MAETIEALLDENLGKVQELLAASEQLQANVTRYQEWGDDVHADLAPLCSSAVDHVRTLQASISDLTAMFEQAEQQSLDTVEEVIRQAAEFESQIQNFAHEAAHATRPVHDQLADVELETGEQMQRVEAALEELSNQAEQYGELADSRVSELESQFEGLRTGIEAGVADLEGKKAGVLSALGALQAHADENINELVSTIQNGVDQSKEQLTGVLQAAEAQLSGAGRQLAESLSEGALGHILESFEDVASVLERAKGGTEGLGGALGDSVGDVIGSIDGVVDLIKQIEPVLDAVNTLL